MRRLLALGSEEPDGCVLASEIQPFQPRGSPSRAWRSGADWISSVAQSNAVVVGVIAWCGRIDGPPPQTVTMVRSSGDRSSVARFVTKNRDEDCALPVREEVLV
jgi:hypothetical protein